MRSVSVWSRAQSPQGAAADRMGGCIHLVKELPSVTCRRSAPNKYPRLLHARAQPPTHPGSPTDLLLQALTANAVAADAPYRLRI